MKYIKNLEDKTQSVLAENIADDAAEIAGLDKDAVSDAIQGLNFSSYLELGNAVSVEDGETIREILNISDIVPEEPMSEIDLEEDKPMAGAPSWAGILWKLSDRKLTKLYNQKMDDCGGVYNPGTSAVTPIKREMLSRGLLTEDNKLLDKPTPTLAELAKKHNVSLAELGSQLAKGIKAELEHTSDRKISKEIALDHLNELPDYYDRLEQVEEAEYIKGRAPNKTKNYLRKGGNKQQ